MVSDEIAASKRVAARVGLALAVVGSAAQVAGYTLGEGDALGFTVLMYAGVLVAAAGAVVAWASAAARAARAIGMAQPFSNRLARGDGWVGTECWKE